ncbi:UPF0481 protein [Nymphaea thermarum]|nr:UPF0481 protein [Nymphaea thermarum]
MAAPSIFHVDDRMRSKRREAFEPQKIALGPYHPSWPPVKQLKDQAFRKLVERTRWGSDSFVNAVVNKEAEASKCYRWDGHPPASQAFREMLWLDGCFLLEIISGKIVSSVPYLEHQQMLMDVLKLENQIPMVVLRELYRLEHGNDRVEELLLNFLFTPANYSGMFARLLQKMHDASHVLDAIRIKMFPGMILTKGAEPGLLSLQKSASTDPGFAFAALYSATELLDAGIVLSPDSSGAVEWAEDSSTLSLPPVTVAPGMDVLFLNMVAFERGNGDWRQPATSCFRLFKDLVRTGDDVRALRSKGVLVNALPTDDSGVVDFFRELKLGDDTYEVDMLCGTKMAVNAKVGSRKMARYSPIGNACFKMPSPSESLAFAAGLVLVLQTVHLIRIYTNSPKST